MLVEQSPWRGARAGCATSRTCLRVPASGDVLTWKYIDSVGSSTAIGGSASGVVDRASVVPMPRSSMPVTSTMSPASACSSGTRSRPAKPEHLADLRPWRIARRLVARAAPSTSWPGSMRAAADAADAKPAEVARVVERADLELQRAVRIAARAPARA